jgi:hypothetical protein
MLLLLQLVQLTMDLGAVHKPTEGGLMLMLSAAVMTEEGSLRSVQMQPALVEKG